VVGLTLAAIVIHFATILIAPDHLFRPLLWTWSIAALATLAMNLTDGVVHRQFGCCAGGIQADKTGSTILLVLLLWPCAGWVAATGRRWFAILATVLICFIVAISGSGASGLAITAGVATLLIGWWRPRAVVASPLLLLLGGFAAILLLDQMNSITNAVTVLDRITGFHSAERLRIWSAYTDLFLHRPWTGFGPGSERFLNSPALHDAFVVAAAPDAVRLHSHNLPLQILVQTGIVGALILLAAATAATFRLTTNSRSVSPFAVAPISSYVAAGTVNFGIWEWWWLTLILVAMIFTSASERGR
jgi:O-antigen ligase